MDCPFKKWGYGHFYGPSYCEKANKKVTSYRYNQYCKSSCYQDSRQKIDFRICKGGSNQKGLLKASQIQ